MSDQLDLNNVILIINTIFTFITPLLYMVLKMIKKCQFGNNAFIETRSDSSPPNSATQATPLTRLQSLFRVNTSQNTSQNTTENGNQ